MKFSDFLTYFTDTIFRRDVTEWRNPVVRWLVQQYRLLFYTARGLLEHGTIVRSAALTFYTLMSLVPILAVVFAVVMIVPILWIVANAVGNYAEQLLGFDDSWYFNLLSHLASMIVIWVMFTFLYIVIPNARVRFGSALMAGIVAGTIFLLFQWGYVYVQRWMTSYNAIYGSFAALPLLLIWMQTSWEILLFGGELSFAYQNIARFGEERESLLISYDQRRKVLLAVMLTVVRNFRDRGGALPADEIRERLDLPTRIVNDVLFQLVQAGQLIAVRSGDGERETAFTPAHDIASMTVYGVLEAVERSGQTIFDLGQTPELARIDRELETLKESARRSQDNVRLTDLL